MKYIHPSFLYARILSHMGSYGIKKWHEFNYHRFRGRWPDFDNPQDLSERILSKMHTKEWLKYADYTDKWKVRDYIKSKGFEDLLLDEYGSWKNANDIDFNKLPNKFALKPNNFGIPLGTSLFCNRKAYLCRRTYGCW